MRWLNWFLQGILVIVCIMVIWAVGPLAETKYFPVYSKFTILEISPVTDGLELELSFTKHRNCDPQGFAWYAGDFGMGRRELNVRVLRFNGAASLPPGTHLTQALFVRGMREEDIPNLYAEVYNVCHPLWVTRSVVYP